jgi:hypothetical protein
MILAYADPPYLGCGAKHYKQHHSLAADFDKVETHARLIERLSKEFPDGWALSLHTPSLRTLLPLCPEGARVGAWVKPFASFKPGVNPGYCWEPVIFVGGRRRGRALPTLRDYVSCNITLKRGLTGVKPEAVCCWIFDMLGMVPGDEMHDLFPGSGAVTRAWKNYVKVKAGMMKAE